MNPATEEKILAALERIEALMREQRSAAPYKSNVDRLPIPNPPRASLDGPHDNPTVRYDPKRWDGPSFVGARYSECSPEYLDALSGYLTWLAGKKASEGNGDKAQYDKADAARARGWAARLRHEASHVQGAPEAQQDAFADDIEGMF